MVLDRIAVIPCIELEIRSNKVLRGKEEDYIVEFWDLKSNVFV